VEYIYFPLMKDIVGLEALSGQELENPLVACTRLHALLERLRTTPTAAYTHLIISETRIPPELQKKLELRFRGCLCVVSTDGWVMCRSTVE
jgi:hypothetical protein